MKNRTKLAAGAGVAIAVAGAGGAIAATKLSPGDETKAVVEDAAKQLGVDPAKLTDALKQALENRIDRAVEDGTLTAEQAEVMKNRVEADDFPLFAGPLLGQAHKGFGFRLFGELDTAASYLGVTEDSLREALRNGKTLAGIAKDEGKTVDGLVDALVTAATKTLDEAVSAGRLTKVQRDKLVADLEQRTTDMVRGERPAFPRLRPGFEHRRGPGPGFHEQAPPPAA